MAVAPDPGQESQTLFPVEPHYLLSNRTYWYPQNPVWDYATATLRVTVPEGYRSVASGELLPASQVVALRDGLTLPNGNTFVFRSDQPLRYLALVVSRLSRVSERPMTIEASRPGADIDKVTVAVEAQPRLQGRGRQLATQVEEIMRFYSTLVGEAPFPSMTIALVESELPGGHSPGYFAVLNEPVPERQQLLARRPGGVRRLPGVLPRARARAPVVGPGTRLEELSRAVAQRGVRAVLRRALRRGRRAATGCSATCCKQFRRWSLSQSDQGPVHLGYRLGHIKTDLRVYRAIVYNKGAAVLHMLRRLLGDEAFFAGLRRFYDDRRFQKAGTDDLERALEAESGRTLDRFFERWIYGTDIPRIAFKSTIGERPGHRALHPAERQRLRPARDRDADPGRRQDPRGDRADHRGGGGAGHPDGRPVRRVQVNLIAAMRVRGQCNLRSTGWALARLLRLGRLRSGRLAAPRSSLAARRQLEYLHSRMQQRPRSARASAQ